MSYKLTIETDSLEELYATVSNLRGKATVVLEAGEDNLPKRAPRKSKEDKVTTLAQPVEKSDVVKQVKTSDDNSVKGGDINEMHDNTPDYESVKKITLELIKNKGKQTALDVLGHFGAQAATELKPEDYEEYIVDVKAAIARL